eukprot:8895421-Ditylum_brightwellii.AAC.1
MDLDEHIKGFNFGHYKALAHSNILSEIQALKSHLVVNNGLLFCQWTHRLQAMLLKEPDNIDVERLRAILLLEADYNWILTEL